MVFGALALASAIHAAQALSRARSKCSKATSARSTPVDARNSR
jgi:Flp pilus assembly protein TadG